MKHASGFAGGAGDRAGEKLDRSVEEALEGLWMGVESGATKRPDLDRLAHVEVNDVLVGRLKSLGLVDEGEDGSYRFTEEGRERASAIIRRHRLAERLVHDVLDVSVSEMEVDACEFEHLVAPGVTESICTLLGHPAQCPHGLPIPEGRCCLEARRTVESVVVSADRMSIGEEARVAYINTRNYARLQKLTSFGITPGVRIKLHQRRPAFVLECDQTQLAIEETLARDIFVFREPKGSG